MENAEVLQKRAFKCRDLLTCAHVCSRVLTYAHVCSRVLTCAHVCSRMLTCAHVCSRVLMCAHVCSRVLTHAHVLAYLRIAFFSLNRRQSKQTIIFLNHFDRCNQDVVQLSHGTICLCHTGALFHRGENAIEKLRSIRERRPFVVPDVMDFKISQNSNNSAMTDNSSYISVS